MRTCRRAGALTLMVLAVNSLAGQAGPVVPRQLSLAQAVQLAKANSPTYRQRLANADPAAAAVRAANWAKLPTLSGSGGVSYTGSGSSSFGGGLTFNQSSPIVSSSYRLSANWNLSPTTFMSSGIYKAEQQATDADIAAEAVQLTADVTAQYLTALRAAAVVQVAAQQLARDTLTITLARNRQQVGQATLIDVLSAQTTLANAQVQLLQVQQSATQAKIELLRRMGVPADANVEAITLVEPFQLVEPNFDLATLLAAAQQSNPTLHAAVLRAEGSHISTRVEKARRLPSFSLSTGLSGYTQQSTNESALINNRILSAQATEANCAFQNEILERLTSPIPGAIIPDCKEYAGLDNSGAALLPSVQQAIHNNNSVFPFRFTKQPMSVSFGISMPIWDGYSTSLRISQAAAAEDQSRENVRSQRLLIESQIQNQLLAVRTAWARKTIQDSNRASAGQQLRLAQARYQQQIGTVLEIADAQNAVTQSEVDYVTAVYDYHLAVVALEAAVGRPIR